MSTIDWLVLGATIFGIVAYGMWKSRGARDIKGYLLSDNDMKWWTITLSIMATQASAITFLSTPGQAFDDGMRFVQFYFGVPIAMVLISVVAIPLYRRLNVFTAYEYLESRFDLKTRSLAASLFLVSRGLAAGMTIYAPAIILASLLDWDLSSTIIGIGLVVMLYTVSGGTKAVSQTQKQQMGIILVGMIAAGVIMILKLPPEVGFGDAVNIAGKMGKLNVITFPDSWEMFITDRYNIFTGLFAGTFLALSYFGTDQSQVQRYLGGKSISESRIGLLFNGLLKVPLQFLILFIGAMMFVFYQFQPQPMLFNEELRTEVVAGSYGEEYLEVERRYTEISQEKTARYYDFLEADALESGSQQSETILTNLRSLEERGRGLREEGKQIIQKHDKDADLNDLDRVFLTFVLNHLPIGLVGLLIAVILSAAMSSTSAELNALATTSLVDFYKRNIRPEGSAKHFLGVSRLLTMGWGILAIAFALFAHQLGNLIQAVNILGSLFYGTILGIFIVAFFLKRVHGTAVFYAAVLAELFVIGCFVLPDWLPQYFGWLAIGYLWYNLLGAMLVVGLATAFQPLIPSKDGGES